MHRKVVEVKSLSGLLDICDDFMTVEPKIDSQKFPEIYEYFQRIVSGTLGVSQNLNNGFKSVSIEPVDRHGDFMKEWRECPKDIRQLTIRASNILCDLYSARHPVKFWLLKTRGNIMMCVAKTRLFLSNLIPDEKNKKRTSFNYYEEFAEHKPPVRLSNTYCKAA